MSSTRTAKAGSQLRQERFASSPALHRCLKANLVALRASLLDSAAQGELIWALQYLSLQPGGLASAAKALRTTETELEKLCLDPESDLERFTPGLKQFFAEYTHPMAQNIAETEVSRVVGEALEYCYQRRCLVVVSGNARLGKTFTARHWCDQNPGRARYVQVPSGGDDLSFFVALAKGLGITIDSDAKAKRLRPRIEAALQSGSIVLVLDDSHYLFPGNDCRVARPSRLCWLMTALINNKVPVCLVATAEFFRTQSKFERKSGWAGEQFTGRIERFISLPERLCIADLKRVATALLPNGDEAMIDTLAAYADLSSKHVAAVEHAVSHARFIANQNGRTEPIWEDVRRAIRENILPSDSRVLAALKDFPSDPRERLAAASPAPRQAIAGRN